MNHRPAQRARRRTSAGATHRVIARGLITDQHGRVLIVLPAIPNKSWYLPGGRIDFGEDPAQGCEREIVEELGLKLTAHELLLTTYTKASFPERPSLLTLLFDCGTYRADSIDRHIDLDPRELAAWRWAIPEHAYDLLHPAQGKWLTAIDHRTRYMN